MLEQRNMITKSVAKATIEESVAKTYLFLAAVLWGLGYVVQELAMGYIGPFTFNGMRFVIGGLLLLLVSIVQRIFKKGNAKSDNTGICRILADNWLPGLVGGIVLFLAMTSLQFALLITGSASRVGFVSSSYILLVPGLACLLRSVLRRSKFYGYWSNKKFKPSEWMGLASAGISILLISVPWSDLAILNLSDLAVSLILLIGAACLATHFLLYEFYAKKKAKIHALLFTAIQLLFCALLSGLFAWLFESEYVISLLSGDIQSNGYILIVISATFPVSLAYILQFIAQRKVALGTTAVICSAEPGFAMAGDLVWNVFVVGLAASNVVNAWMLLGIPFMIFGFMIISKGSKIALWINEFVVQVSNAPYTPDKKDLYSISRYGK